MLCLTFWAAILSLSLSACSNYTPPLLTLTQLDIKNNQANDVKITKYNKETCRLELEAGPSYPIMGSSSPLHGAICLTKDEYAKLRDSLESECKNANEKQKAKDVHAANNRRL
jgi:glutathionylspermidine synthase